MDDKLIEILLIIAAGLFGFLVKDYFPSYAKKKGENLATKEDISEITEKIESIKAEKDREKQYLTSKQLHLMKFYDEITEFHYELLAVNFGDFPSDGGKSLFEYQNTFYSSVSEILKAYQRLVIFLPKDEALLRHAHEITLKATEARVVLKENFGEIKFTSAHEHEAFIVGEPLEKKQAVKASDEANKNYWDKMHPIIEAYKESYQLFLGEMNEFITTNK